MEDIRDSAIDITGSPRYSDDSDGLDIRIRDLVDRRLNPLPHEFTSSPPSPETDSRSSGSIVHSPSHEKRRRSSRRDRGRYSGVQQELVKLFASEESEARQHRKLLRAALERLDIERQRAQEAERRALELAGRFQVVNEARVLAQTELSRVKEELSYYKLEYDVAQRELKRGQEMLNHAEAQRDDAEATAARARSSAQRIKEKHLVLLAKEEGRKLGFEEGLKRGYEEGRASGYNAGRLPDGPLVEDDDVEEGANGTSPTSPSGGARTEPLADLPMRNLPSPPRDSISLDQSESRFPPAPENTAGAQGSRFHENDLTPSTTPQFIRPVPIHDAPPFPMHPVTPIPPDNWIPPADGDNFIAIPPPHEFQRPHHSPQHSPKSSSPPLPIPIPPPQAHARSAQTPPDVPSQDYAYVTGRSPPPSLASLAESVPSTTMSNFDLLNSPKSSSRNAGRSNREPGSGLSVIHEVSSSMEHSPGMDDRSIPEPVTFPTAPGNREWQTDPSSSNVVRSRITNQRLADETSYTDPGAVDIWRRTTAEKTHSTTPKSGPRRPAVLTMPSPLAENSRPRSVGSDRHSDRHSTSSRSRTPTGSHGTSQRQQPPSRLRQSHTPDHPSFSPDASKANSSSEIEIRVEPPSAPESHSSPAAPSMRGLLSPVAPPEPLPSRLDSPREVPTVPNTPTMRSKPPLGIPVLPDGLPPGFVPTGPVSHVSQNSIPIHAPIAQSSPRIPGMQIYSNIPGSSTPPSHQRSASTSSALNPNIISHPRSSSRHSRTRSTGGLGSMSQESLHAKSPTPGLRPSSAMSGASGAQSISRAKTPSQPQYAAAPTPPGMQYPDPPYIQAGGRPDRPPSAMGNMSPHSISSRLSGHQRSLSMNAGMTPGPHARPLSAQMAPSAEVRRAPSAGSMSSLVSGQSRKSVNHFDPNKYADPAWFASSEDLVSNVPSPRTDANTRTNAGSSSGFRVIPGSRGPPSPVNSYSTLTGRKGR